MEGSNYIEFFSGCGRGGSFLYNCFLSSLFDFSLTLFAAIWTMPASKMPFTQSHQMDLCLQLQQTWQPLSML